MLRKLIGLNIYGLIGVLFTILIALGITIGPPEMREAKILVPLSILIGFCLFVGIELELSSKGKDAVDWDRENGKKKASRHHAPHPHHFAR